jgi:hypothetical protein
VLGALAAVHRDILYTWVLDRWRWLLAGFGASLAGMWGLLQPMMVPYAAFVILTCYGVGVRWARRYDPWPRLSGLIVLAAELSFGVYLLHPMVLQELTAHTMSLVAAAPRLLVTPLTTLAVYGITLAAVRVIAATPAAVYVIGRAQLPLRRPRWLGARTADEPEPLTEAPSR